MIIKRKEKNSTKKIRMYFLALLVSFFTWFILHTAFIIIDGLNDEIEKADVAVVLGNKVELDGRPSNRLQARLDKAVELYDQGYFNSIVVSGGLGKEGFDEAGVMKKYLVEHGLPAEIIIEDNDGINSHMTAKNTATLTKELNVKSVMIITQYFHITRTKLAFKKLGYEQIYSAHAEIFEWRDLYSIVREFPAYYKYQLHNTKSN